MIASVLDVDRVDQEHEPEHKSPLPVRGEGQGEGRPLPNTQHLTPITRWKAIDVESEERLECEFRRPKTWRQMLFRWLYEYNRY